MCCCCCGSFGLQLRYMLWKNWILKKRHWISTVFELCLPMLIMLLLVAIRGLVDITQNPASLNNYACQQGNPCDYNSQTVSNIQTDFVYDAFYRANTAYNKSVNDIKFRYGMVPNTPASHDLAGYLFNKTLGVRLQQVPCMGCGGDQFYAPQLKYSDFFMFFETDSALEAYYTSQEYGFVKDGVPQPFLRWAVVLDSWPVMTPSTILSNQQWGYTLRMNATTICDGGGGRGCSGNEDCTCFNDVPSTSGDAVNTLQRGPNNQLIHSYNHYFTGLQSLIDYYIMSQQMPAGSPVAQALAANGGSPPYWVSEFMPFPNAAYTSDPFVAFVSAVLGLWFMLVFLWPFSRIVRALVDEKEQKLREGMKMMGLTDSVFWTSWFLTYVIIFVITAILITIVTSGSVYKHSNKSIVFFFFFFFMMSCFSFAVMISAFFDRAKTAAIFSCLFFFGIYFPYYAITDGTTRDLKTLACLSSPLALGLGAIQFAKYEAAGTGIQNDNLWEVHDNFSIGAALQMICLDIIIYLVLGLYFDRVVPSKYGQRLPPWFCISPFWWMDQFRCCRGQRKIPQDNPEAGEQEALYDQAKFEPVQANLRDKVVMSVKHLRKEFPGTVAVADTTLDLYEGQIVALLGHNGAGKTTTISMLTGLIEPTSGDAFVNGHSISNEMHLVRKELGVCPQDNVLFNDLTVREHLLLFASLRGLSGENVQHDIDEMLKEIALTEKKDALSSSLSGGQKRKLCVGMAMIGGSKVIFLDEPTSGVDPFSRRAFWGFLKKRKAGRVIVLTTHMMDEADQLGDRIAIMAKGCVQCCGSSLFLKRLYGVGYTMTVGLDDRRQDKERDVTALTETLTDLIPGLEAPKVSGGEVFFRLPFSASSNFPALFTQLDREVNGGGDQFGVVNYGISVTTLEEVFLKVDSDAQHAAKKQETMRDADFDKVLGSNHQEDQNNVHDPHSIDDEKNMCYLHFWALLVKRYHNYKRDKRGLVFQLIIPLLVMILGLAVLSAIPIPEYPLLAMNSEQYGNSGANPLSFPFNPTFSYNYAEIPACSNVTDVFPNWQCCWQWTGDVAQCVQNSFCYDSWTNTYQCPKCDQCWYNFGMGEDITLNHLSNMFENPATSSSFFSSTSNPMTTGLKPEAVLVPGGMNDSAQMSMYLLGVTGAYPTSQADLTAARMQPLPAGYPTTIPTSRAGWDAFGAYWAPAHNTPNPNAFPFKQFSMTPVTVMVNTTAQHSVPVFLNAFNNMLLRNLSGQAGIAINTNSHPFSITYKQKLLASQPSTIMAVLVIGIGFCFIPASFVMLVTRERETNAKHQQIISGVGYFAYWSSGWAWDFTAYLITACFATVILVLFDVSKLVGSNLGATVAILLFYGLSVTSFAQLFSFLFKSPSNAQNAMIFFNFLTGVILAIVSWVLDLIVTFRDTNRQLKMIWRLVPNFCMSNGLLNILFRDDVAFWGEVKSATDFDIIGLNLVYMACEAVGFFLLTLGIEHLSSMTAFLRRFQVIPTVPKDNYEPDEDVEAEKQRLMRKDGAQLSEQECEQGGWIRCEGLQKVYGGRGGQPPKAAVRDFWLGVPQGECFGFLGINGAGKTSVLSMLSCDRLPSNGEAFLRGIDMMRHPERVRRLIGYCPQFDALFELLTGREHLQLYGRIKGVPERALPAFVDKMLDKLSLKPWADVISQSYSGGNKRKLSVGIALIGNPPIVYLDEPSSGMDPGSRRSMWDLISSTMAGRAVMLTTHSMEECEALCSRIGIMVSGRLRCLGSAHHLKQRFGQGFQLDVTIGFAKAAQADQAARAIADGNENKASVEGQGDEVEMQPLAGSEVKPTSSSYGAQDIPAVRIDSFVIADVGDNAEKNTELLNLAIQNFQKFISANFPDSRLLEAHNNRLKFRVPSNIMSLGALFTTIEKYRDVLHIEEYSVSQTTLEQIFVHFARQQEEEKGPIAGLSPMQSPMAPAASLGGRN